MQIVPVKDNWGLLGEALGKFVLPRLYENYNRRDAYKEINKLKAEDAATITGGNYNQFNNALTQYTNAKDTAVNSFKALADEYNNPATTEARRQELATQMNTMGSKIAPGMKQDDPMYWTNVLGKIQDGSDAQLQPMKLKLNQLQQYYNPYADTNDANRYANTLNTLKTQNDAVNNYAKYNQGRTVSGSGDNQFVSFNKYANDNGLGYLTDYGNRLPQYVKR